MHATSSDDFSLSSRVALVTGAGRGIGRGIALALARAGADVAVADLDPQVAEETAAAIRSLGRRSLALGVDVSDGDSVRAMVERVATEFGRLDVAVNNAGVISIRKVAELSLADWDRVMNVNARGVFLCCQAELPLMQAQRWGRIVNLSSIAGKVGLPDLAHYCASKFAVIGFSNALAKEVARDGVTVNALCPGNRRHRNVARRGRLVGPLAAGRRKRGAVLGTPPGQPAAPGRGADRRRHGPARRLPGLRAARHRPGHRRRRRILAMTPPSPIVGIIANPASGRDLRRLTAHAGLHSSTDKASVVQRLLAAFGATGIRHALLPPDMTGIAAAVLRASQTRQARDGHWPFLEFLDMPLRQSVEDTRLAARRMVERGVALIAVLGGDGTHKAVAAEVGDVPLLALSTGTNNAFPELREATGAGLAGGLCASNRVPPEIGLRRNKRLLVREPRRGLCEWALVDVAVSPQPFIGARAISRAEDLAEVFVSFAEPHAIGLSALCGLWSPVSREEPHGAWMRLHPDARESLLVPLAPGLLVGCGVSAAGYLQPGVAHAPSLSSGTLALDGEREIEFSATDRPSITLDPSGPFSVDVPATLAYAARHRLLAGQRTPMTP